MTAREEDALVLRLLQRRSPHHRLGLGAAERGSPAADDLLDLGRLGVLVDLDAGTAGVVDGPAVLLALVSARRVPGGQVEPRLLSDLESGEAGGQRRAGRRLVDHHEADARTELAGEAAEQLREIRGRAERIGPPHHRALRLEVRNRAVAVLERAPGRVVADEERERARPVALECRDRGQVRGVVETRRRSARSL